MALLRPMDRLKPKHGKVLVMHGDGHLFVGIATGCVNGVRAIEQTFFDSRIDGWIVGNVPPERCLGWCMLPQRFEQQSNTDVEEAADDRDAPALSEARPRELMTA